MDSPIPQINPDAPVLVLAPHLSYPQRTGGSILIHERWRAFSRFVPYVDIVGRSTAIRYSDGASVAHAAFYNPERTRREAAFRTILRRSQYQLEKFVTREFASEARKHLDDTAYGLIVGSYLYSIPILQDDFYLDHRVHLVETHNDDFKWYRSLREGASNPIARHVATLSEKWTAQILAKHETDLLYIHVTETDRAGYLSAAPKHASIIAPIGVAIPEDPPVEHPPREPIRLLFVGSLGVTMNVDALTYFGRDFFPELKDALGDALTVDVVGSNPGQAVRLLCEEHGWELHPDAPDELLSCLLHRASFTLLPFEYATGAKLKLLESLAHGVPFLATTRVQAQLESIPPACLASDDPAEWAAHVGEAYERGQSLEERLSLVDTARNHSWESSARRIFELLTNEAARSGAGSSPNGSRRAVHSRGGKT